MLSRNDFEPFKNGNSNKATSFANWIYHICWLSSCDVSEGFRLALRAYWHVYRFSLCQRWWTLDGSWQLNHVPLHLERPRDWNLVMTARWTNCHKEFQFLVMQCAYIVYDSIFKQFGTCASWVHEAEWGHSPIYVFDYRILWINERIWFAN